MGYNALVASVFLLFVLGKFHIPHPPSSGFDRVSYTYLGLPLIGLSIGVGTWYLIVWSLPFFVFPFSFNEVTFTDKKKKKESHLLQIS